MKFTNTTFIGSEDTRFVLITLELVGGTSAYPFSVTVTPLEQSAKGNSIAANS